MATGIQGHMSLEQGATQADVPLLANGQDAVIRREFS